MKLFLQDMTKEEETKLLDYLDDSIKKTADEEIAHGLQQMDVFLKKKNIILTMNKFKIYFTYFLWVGFHFVDIGALKEASAYYESYNMKNEGIDLEDFLSYEEEVLEFFEDTSGSC